MSRNKIFLILSLSFLFLFSSNILSVFAQEQDVTNEEVQESEDSEQENVDVGVNSGDSQPTASATSEGETNIEEDTNTGEHTLEGTEVNEEEPVEEIITEEEPIVESVIISFKDVTSHYWAYTNISHLTTMQIISGYTDEGGENYFAPNNNVTRAQAAKMIVEALKLGEATTGQLQFSDVSRNHWAAGYIERVAELGIFGGYQDGRFGPNDTLKRSQMAKVLAEAFHFQYNGYSPSNQVFKDVAPTYWANDYILRLHYNGISNGSNYRFMPEALISRAQFSAFLSRALDDRFRVPVTGPVIAKGKVVAKTSLNIRLGQSTDFPLIGEVPSGAEVNITEINGYWAKINYNGIIGYVHKSYLKLLSIDVNKPLKDRIIVIDAGHGGKDPGAVVSTTYEKDIVFKVTDMVVSKLKEAGANVIKTREDDTFLSLEERVQFTQNVFAETFVSIHVNAADNTSAKGTEVFYDMKTNMNGPESKKLAYEIQQELVQQAGMYDRNIKDTGFYVIKNNQIPAVLVELGFLTNAEDRVKLKSDAYLERFANAIYDGIVQYYQQ